MSSDYDFNTKNFLSHLIFHPDHGTTKVDREQAWKYTFLLGIFTVGMTHVGAGLYQLGCYLYDQYTVTRKTSGNLDEKDAVISGIARNQGVVLEEGMPGHNLQGQEGGQASKQAVIVDFASDQPSQQPAVSTLQASSTASIPRESTDRIVGSNSATLAVEKSTRWSMLLPDPSSSTSALAWLEECGGQEGVEKAQEQLMTKGLPYLEKSAEKVLRSLASKDGISTENFNIFMVELKKVAYLRDLLSLKQKLTDQVGQEKAIIILSQLEGTQDYSNQDALLEKALGNTSQEELFDHALASIGDGKLKRITQQEALILQRFPILQRELTNDQAKRFQAALNKIHIEKLLASNGAFDSSTKGSNTVHWMGYNAHNFREKERLHTVMGTILESMLGDEAFLQSKSLTELHKQLQKRAYEERLLYANVVTSDLQLVKKVIKENNKLEINLSKSLNSINIVNIEIDENQNSHISLSHTPNATLRSPFVDSINLLSTKYKQRAKIKILKTFASACTEFKGQPSETALSNVRLKIEGALKAKEALFHEDAFEKELILKLEKSTEVKWYQKYHQNLIVPFIQGFYDVNEVFGEGCCFAICHRLIETLIKHPEVPVEQLQADVVLPKDRYLQAQYSTLLRFEGVKAHLTPIADLDPGEILGMMMPPYEDESAEDVFLNVMPEFIRQAISCEGILKIGLTFNNGGGHVTFLQINHERGLYKIYDPNLGLLCFPRPEALSDQAMEIKVIKAYNDLLSSFYDDIKCRIVIKPVS